MKTMVGSEVPAPTTKMMDATTPTKTMMSTVILPSGLTKIDRQQCGVKKSGTKEKIGTKTKTRPAKPMMALIGESKV